MRTFMMLLMLAGCGGSESKSTGSTGTWIEPEPRGCPEAQPATGQRCDHPLLCYYYDECTRDSMGVVADCQNGKWEIGYDQIRATCGAAPKNGDPCPCGTGGRQPDCSFTCDEGGSLEATCDPATLKWKVTAPATCTPRAH